MPSRKNSVTVFPACSAPSANAFTSMEVLLFLREEYPQIPPKAGYSLTERGRSLIPILDQMCDWGEKNVFNSRSYPFFHLWRTIS